MNKNKIFVADLPGHDVETARIASLCLSRPNIMVIGNPEYEREKELEALKKQILDEDKMAKSFINAVVGAGVHGMLGFPIRRKREEPLTKCGLPGCEVMSVKDYCSAEHCRQHRKMRKA